MKLKINYSFYIFIFLFTLSLFQYYEFWKLYLWIDEFGTYKFASGIQSFELETHTPVYYYLVRWSIELWGVNLFAMRFPNLILSLVTLIISSIYFFKEKNRHKAQLVFIFVNMNPTAWTFLRESRVYYWLFIFAWASIYLNERYLSERKIKNLNYMYLFYLISSWFDVISLMLMWALTFSTIFLEKAKTRKHVIYMVLMTILTSLPILIYYFYYKDMSQLKWQVSWVPSFGSHWWLEYPKIFLGKKWTQFLIPNEFFVNMFSLGTLAILGTTIFKYKNINKRAYIYFGTVIFFHIGMFIIYPFMNLFISKFFIATVPIFLFGIALVLQVYQKKMVPIVISLIIFSYNIWGLDLYNESKYKLPLANIVKDHKNDRLLVLCDTWQMGHAIRDIYFSNYNVISCDDKKIIERVNQFEKIMIFVVASYLDDRKYINATLDKRFQLEKRYDYELQKAYLELYRRKDLE